MRTRAASRLRLALLVAIGQFTISQIPLAQSPIVLVQHNSRDAGITTSSTLAFPAGTTNGNWIGVVIRAGRTGQTFTVSDTRGNAYRRAVQVNETTDGTTIAIYYAENIVGGATTVTVADSLTDGTLRFAILEYSGLASASSLDGASAAQGTSAAPASGPATLAAPGDLVIGLLSSANPRTFTAGSGWTIRERVPAAPDTKLAVEDRISATAGQVSAAGTLSASDSWGAAVAAFRAASPAAPDSQPPTAPGTPVPMAVSSTQINLVWPAATDDVGVTNYFIERCSGQNCTTFAHAGTSTTTSFNDTGLAPSTSYSYRVDATDAAGNTGPYSPVASATTQGTADTQPPGMPGTPLLTVVSSGQIDLKWTGASDNVGVTAYHIEQCQGAGCSTFSEIATVPARSLSGPLTASSNPNYFKDRNGDTLILNGAHTWNNLQDWGMNGTLQPLDFTAYVNQLVAHGNNFTLLWRIELPTFCSLPTTDGPETVFTTGPHPWLRTGPGTATDGGLRFDLTTFDPAYFDRLRSRVQALYNAGIYAGVYLFSGEWVNAYRCAIDGYPLGGENNINGIDDGGGIGSMTMTAPNAITAIQDAYVDKVIDTLNDLPNVLWIVSEEAPANSTWWNAHLIAHARAYESGKPARHPVGYAVMNDHQDAVVVNSDADWVATGENISPTTSCGSGTPRCKVNLNDSDHSYFGMWNDSAQDNRNYAWKNFMTGNQVAFMDPYVVDYPREGRNLCVSPTNGICSAPDSRWDNFRDNLGYIVTYSRKLNLANVTPRGVACASTGFCLAQTPPIGAEYLVYAPSGGAFAVDLSAMSADRTLNVEWFDPSTGTTTLAGSVQAGSSRTVTPPFDGDAVLYLVDSAGHAGSNDSSGQLAYSSTGLSAATSYSYRVRAADAAGNLGPYSPTASAVTPGGADTQPPTAPGMPIVTAASPSQIDLTWPPATDDVGVVGYFVERCTGAGCAAFTQIGTSATASFTDTGLTPTTSYSYRVRATDAAGNSGAYSPVGSATTLGTVPIALVQHTNRDAGMTTSSSLAFPATTASGDWIAVVIRAGQTGQTFTVGDTRGNTYRRAVQLNETADGTTVAIYYAENITGGATTVIVSDTLSGTLRFAILEYAGLATVSSLDVSATAQGISATPTSATATTTAAGDLIIGALSTANGRTFTAGSGWTIEDRVPAAPNTKLAVEDRVLAAAGPIAANGSLSASDAWGTVVAAFRAAAAVPAQNLALVPAPAAAAGSAAAAVYVTFDADAAAHRDDVLAPGQNLNESLLTPSSVSPATFGKLFSYALDGAASASPLYVAGVTMPDGSVHDVVYVATAHDSVLAFDADGRTPGPLWQRSFISPAAGTGVTTVPANDAGDCCDRGPEIGVTGTPAIDPATGTLYLMATTKELSEGRAATYVERLHALDITSGAEKFGGPVVIQTSVDAFREEQRSDLLLRNGAVYIVFGGAGAAPVYFNEHIYYAYPGAAIAISANGDANGIVWAVRRNGTLPGVLSAYDAADLGLELYSSDQAAGGRDALDEAPPFSVPLVANGKVFVGSMGRLTAYGLLR